MCTLERHRTKSKILQQPVAITGLQLLTKHDGASAGLAGQVVLQGPGKPAGRVLLHRGGNFQEQSAAKLHLPHMERKQWGMWERATLEESPPVFVTFPFSGASAS